MKFHNDTGVLVRRKGGNVPGYTALLAFVPELELSLSILWSGAADEFTWSIHVFDLILPPWLDMMHNLLETKPQTQLSFFGKNYTPNSTSLFWKK